MPGTESVVLSLVEALAAVCAVVVVYPGSSSSSALTYRRGPVVADGRQPGLPPSRHDSGSPGHDSLCCRKATTWPATCSTTAAATYAVPTSRA